MAGNLVSSRFVYLSDLQGDDGVDPGRILLAKAITGRRPYQPSIQPSDAPGEYAQADAIAESPPGKWLGGGVRYNGQRILPSSVSESHASRDMRYAASHHWPVWRKQARLKRSTPWC